MTMTHPGLPVSWAWVIAIGMVLVLLVAWLRPLPASRFSLSLARIPLLGKGLQAWLRHPGPLLFLKLVFVALFLLVIFAGLYGTPYPERNLATVLTWNIWWAGLIMAVFFTGTAWCGVCPWDTLASFMVRHRIWGRSSSPLSLELKVPRPLRTLWPALGLFIGLTWLELGVGVTVDPRATALLALLMVMLAVASMAVYEDKAFCRFFCPVGRTVGAYAQLSVVELRPIDADICASCRTLECYHGNADIAPCPTHLVMGRLTENTFCTACGNCVQSCPDRNVGWRLRSPSREALQEARPRWDEAWFMLGLLALTSFHGITMLPVWEDQVLALGRQLGDSGQFLLSFTAGLLVCTGAVVALYLLLLWVGQWLDGSRSPRLRYRQRFSVFSFALLPLAFAYHLAHNLNHLVREGMGLTAVLLNPLGIGVDPMGMAEKHFRHLHPLLPQSWLFAIQAALMLFGFWLAVRVVVARSRQVQGAGRGTRVAVIAFAVLVTGFHTWILMQPMVMRM